MDTEKLSNLATALEAAQLNEDMVDIFTFEIWGYPREGRDQEIFIREAFTEYDEEGDEYFCPRDVDIMKDHLDNVVDVVPHNCGAPACALGHYALRTDLQSDFVLDADGIVKTNLPFTTPDGIPIIAPNPRNLRGAADRRVCEHFDISLREASALFGTGGCNNAKTPGQAASFIRKCAETGIIPPRYQE